MSHSDSRRKFLKNGSLIGAGSLFPLSLGATSPGRDLQGIQSVHQFGKREGYTAEISILVSMMNWMRNTVLRTVDGLETKELDYLLDDEANTIGGMLMHLAATERFYQIHTFENRPWGNWDKEDRERWTTASRLGKPAQKKIKGNPLSFYTDALSEVRENTLRLLREKDDDWLYESTAFFANLPTNNYCKWFHVVEHESNHNGQIKLILGRI